MPLRLVDVVSMIRDNMRKSGNPLGVDPRQCSSWAEGHGIPRGGEAIIYTSCMYQSIPYIVGLTSLLERVEGAPSALLSLGRALARMVDVAGIASRSAEGLDRFGSIVRGIALALKRQGISFGYLYEDEPYSGALLYELGLEEDFAEHARAVAKLFAERGVRRVITIDPHTHYILSRVYPRYVEGFSLEVSHYLEVLDTSRLSRRQELGGGDLVIHDPCLLARFTGVVEPQRRVLEGLGIPYKEPQRSGKRTRCCGGPLEALSPRLSRRLGELRAEELASIGKRVIVMCPICFSNLSRVSKNLGLEVLDLSELFV